VAGACNSEIFARGLLRSKGRGGLSGCDVLAARASTDPFFLGSALSAYQRRHRLDDAGLAAVLGCAPALLTQLRLCRRPGSAEPGRTAEGDVAQIAAASASTATDEQIFRELIDKIFPSQWITPHASRSCPPPGWRRPWPRHRDQTARHQYSTRR
jgi:hypothetical protein